MTDYEWAQCSASGWRHLFPRDNGGSVDTRYVIWIERGAGKNRPFVLRAGYPEIEMPYFSLLEAEAAGIELHMGLALFPYTPPK